MTPAITPEETSAWAKLVYDNCGIYLDQSKSYLLSTRLVPLLKETNAPGFSDLYYKVRTSAALKSRVIDAITTNETSFFRDTAPFELLRHKLVPELLDRRSAAGTRSFPIRVWSSACSTGQEVYTIAIIMRELVGNSGGYDIRIVGTDISNRAVAQASRGIYSKLEMERGLPLETMSKHFSRVEEGWKIRDEIRAMASFRTMNLLQPFAFPAPFDIILCRNVAIYFTEQDRARLFRSLGQFLARDGALIIGSTESLMGLCPEYEARRYLRAVYYQLRPKS